MMTDTQKPELLKQTDIVSFYHIQMPRWLFADKRYNYISLAAKVAYSLLLNRYQLSKLNGWINEAGEVYIIFPREELAEELQVGIRKAIGVFKELTDAALVWETRRGNNKANLIYLTKVVLSPEDGSAHCSAPFIEADYEAGCAENACPDGQALLQPRGDEYGSDGDDVFGHAENALPDTLNEQVRTGENDISGDAENALPEVRKTQPSNTYVSYTEKSYTDSSQSVSNTHEGDGLTGGEIEELDEILENCELHVFSPQTARIFENAIERLYFSESFRIGNCVLPREKVRSHLRELNSVRLQDAEFKISCNTERKIKNTTAYTMAVIFNSIWESESDVMCDPYLNSLRSTAAPAKDSDARGSP